MSPIALKRLREATDTRWALLTYWLQEGGQDSLRRFCASNSHGDEQWAEDAASQACLSVYRSGGPSADDAFACAAEGSFDKLEGLVIKAARDHLSLASHQNRKVTLAMGFAQLDERHEQIADEFAEDELESYEDDWVRRLLLDALRNALSDDERNVMLFHTFGGLTFSQIAAQMRSSRNTTEKRFHRSVLKMEHFVRASSEGEHCSQVSKIIGLIIAGDDVGDEATAALRDHANHCETCRQVLANGQRSLREAALFLPLPFVIAPVAQGGGVLESVQGAWASFTNRINEIAAPVINHPAVHVSKPVATGGAVVALLLGGGGVYKAVESGGGETAKANPSPVPSQPAPAPAPKAQPAPKPEKKHKKKPKARPKSDPAPAPAAPANTPAPSGVDDGSSEFAPEAR